MEYSPVNIVLFVLKLMDEVKPSFTEVVLLYYRRSRLSNTLNRDVMATMITAILADLSILVRKVAMKQILTVDDRYRSSLL